MSQLTRHFVVHGQRQSTILLYYQYENFYIKIIYLWKELLVVEFGS